MQMFGPGPMFGLAPQFKLFRPTTIHVYATASRDLLLELSGRLYVYQTANGEYQLSSLSATRYDTNNCTDIPENAFVIVFEKRLSH